MPKIDFQTIRDLDDLRDILEMLPANTKVRSENYHATCDAERYVPLRVSVIRGKLIFH